jgi:replicative DNA helicase
MFTDYDAECRVLSAMMHSEQACIEALDSLHDTDFTDAYNRQLFQLLTALFAQHRITPTLVEVLKEGQKLGFITSLKDIESVKNIAKFYIDDENIKYWIGKVRQAKKARDMQSLLRRFNAQMQDGIKDINQFITEASSEFFGLAMDSAEEKIDTPEELAELGIRLVNERVEKYRQIQEDAKFYGKVLLEGVPTGIPVLDRNTLGMKPGDLIILGAQTGHGKTAFALNVAKAVCIGGQNNILYVNTEMSRAQIAYRWGSILSGIGLSRIRGGNLTNEELSHVMTSYETLRRSGFYPTHIPNLTPQKLDILARKAKIQLDIKLLILDYVGRMDKIQPDMAEWQVLEQIIKSMKLLAQNLDIACLALVQLNPDGTLQGAKRMENECDLMLKLIPVKKDDKKELEEILKKQFEEFNYRIFVQKARDAEGGMSIPIIFDKPKQQIREAEELKTGWEDLGQVVEG